MKNKGICFLVLICFLLSLFSIVVSAEETTTSNKKYYLGEVVQTGLDNGFSGEKKIQNGDPHFGWKLGEFYVDGFTANTKDEEGNPIFLKNVGDKVTLWFNLLQDIDQLNGNESLSISDDNNGYDEYFDIPKTYFDRGALIIRKTDYTNAKGEPVIYTDYLAAKVSKDADTEVELCEEGDYEVALDYEIKNDPRKIFDVSIIPTYTNYRIFFKFSVRNGNCMVYPFDVKTKGELTNAAVTENGFYLDFANSRYLDINIKKEVLNEGANGLVEDTRFNRPAKDGEMYTEEGIYTIIVSNKYTGQLTTKKIYVGTDDIMKAVAATGLSVEEVQEYISNGATVETDGSITLSNSETIAVQTTDTLEKEPTEKSPVILFVKNNLIWIIIGCSILLFVVIVIIILFSKKRKKNKLIKAKKELENLEEK